MADYRTAAGIGARVKALRKARGLKSAQDLVDLMPGTKITVSTIENLESGRRDELGVGQLLNIAFALQAPPAYLLAPLGRPLDAIDIPNLTVGLASMTVIEFDAWISGNIDRNYRWGTADELDNRNQLNALRELVYSRRELRRIQAIGNLTSEQSSSDGLSPSLEERGADAQRRVERLERFLYSAGWPHDAVEDRGRGD